MERITKKQLETLINRLNKLTNSPERPYTVADGKCTANPGCYYLAGAYGGYKLERMSNAGGGCHDVVPTGYTTKHALYDAIYCYLSGIDAGREEGK